MTLHMLSGSVLATLACATMTALASDVHDGVGSAGVELGHSRWILGLFGAHLDLNVRSTQRNFRARATGDDTSARFFNLAAYLDYYTGNRFRLAAPAPFGNHSIEVVARSATGTERPGGPELHAAGFDPDSPPRSAIVTPYLGIGLGKSAREAVLRFLGDDGIRFGHADADPAPAVQATGSKRADPAIEQGSTRDKTNAPATQPVLRVGVTYTF